MTPRNTGNRVSGLTATEILILLLVLGALVLAVLPNIVDRLDEAREKAARETMSELQHALEYYRLDNQLYPTSEQGLRALVEKPTLEPVPDAWRAGGYYHKRLPTDPWGNAYRYESNRGRGEYRLTCLGSDGQTGGSGFAADIILLRTTRDLP